MKPWKAILEEYNYDYNHGKSNVVADGFFRPPQNDTRGTGHSYMIVQERI